MSPKRLLVLTTHPIQYMAPWFRSLSREPSLAFSVLFLREPDAQQQGIGFGTAFSWDVPLRDGYESSVLDCAMGAASLPVGSLAIARELHRRKPDAVLITGWNEPLLIAACAAARLLRIPIIMRGEANAMRARSRGASTLHRTLLQQCSAVTTIGRANRAFYRGNGVAEQRLFDGCYFVETERMLAMAAEHAADRASLRTEYGFNQQDVVFCFVGKHVAFKRPKLMIDAAAILLRQDMPVKLLMAGSGDLTDELKTHARECGVTARFTGFLNQTELWKVYCAADAMVLPSNNTETWGLVTNEAMLFGLPVIVSDQVGCGSDLVQDDNTGYVFQGDAQGLAEAMERMVRQGERRRQMGRQARQLIEEKYSMPVATAGLLQAVEAVTKRR